MNTLKMILLVCIACAPFIGCHEVVYTHRDMGGAEATWGKPQIYVMRDDGTNQRNLSNRNRDEYSPDVRHDGKKIVFVADGAIYVMDIDGGSVAPVPNAPSPAGAPRWSRGQAGGDFLLFSYPDAFPNAAIYRIAYDGSGLTRITNPAPTQQDEMAESIDDKHIVFVRYDPQNNSDRDLYVKYIWDDRPEVRLTNTPNQSETLPVMSHDGKLLAYRVSPSLNTPKEGVDVARFTGEASITVVHTINLQPPADKNISGIDFSQDDAMLFISAQASDVSGNLINRKQEIFKARLDGTNQGRLTANSDLDCCPSAVP